MAPDSETGRRYSNEELLEQLRFLHEQTGRPLNDADIRDIRREYPHIASPTTFFRRIGSTATLNAALGLELPEKEKGNRYESEQVLFNMAEWAGQFDDFPDYSAYKEQAAGNSKLPNPPALNERFGGYNEALRLTGALEYFSIKSLQAFSKDGLLLLPEDSYMSRNRRRLSRHLSEFNLARSFVELGENSGYGGRWLPYKSHAGQARFIKVKSDEVSLSIISAPEPSTATRPNYFLNLPLSRQISKRLKNRIYLHDEHELEMYAIDTNGRGHSFAGKTMSAEEAELTNRVIQHAAADFASGIGKGTGDTFVYDKESIRRRLTKHQRARQ